jgi:hypothetical protein
MNLYGMSANPWTRFADTPLLVTSKACREAVLSMTCESKRDHVHTSGDVPSHGLAMKGPDLTNRVNTSFTSARTDADRIRDISPL